MASAMLLPASSSSSFVLAPRAPTTKLFMCCGNVAASATLPLATKGGQFIRPHLLDLAPYTPIEPFEVSSYSPQNFVVVCLLF